MAGREPQTGLDDVSSGGAAVTVTATDLFCGAGGSSLGAEAVGMRLVMAANHWQTAIDVHQAQFRTLTTTVLTSVKPTRAVTWDVGRFAEQLRYDAVVVELSTEPSSFRHSGCWSSSAWSLWTCRQRGVGPTAFDIVMRAGSVTPSDGVSAGWRRCWCGFGRHHHGLACIAEARATAPNEPEQTALPPSLVGRCPLHRAPHGGESAAYVGPAGTHFLTAVRTVHAWKHRRFSRWPRCGGEVLWSNRDLTTGRLFHPGAIARRAGT